MRVNPISQHQSVGVKSRTNKENYSFSTQNLARLKNNEFQKNSPHFEGNKTTVALKAIKSITIPTMLAGFKSLLPTQAQKQEQEEKPVFKDYIDTSELCRSEVYDSNNELQSYTEFYRSNAGEKIQKKVEFNPDKTIHTITTYEYVKDSPKNYLRKTFNSDGQGNLQWYTTYKYSNGELKETENYDANGEFIHKTVYGPRSGETTDYDANDIRLRSKTWDIRSKGGYVLTEYDENNNELPLKKVTNRDNELYEYLKYDKQNYKEYRYYLSGKLKSVAKVSPYNREALSDRTEYYENGVVKYTENRDGYKNFREDGTLIEQLVNERIYSGSSGRFEIFKTNTYRYAPDGKTIVGFHHVDLFKDGHYSNIKNEEDLGIDYTDDGRKVKKVYSNTRHYEMNFDDEQDLNFAEANVLLD